ncbi:hypothetical protein HNQ07_000765 [Deinococcus metalli]|uniref:Uncharacterized protein n=1 Tax=Deinococcus metalli TaxID=1141878 RepID=A0A7W8NN34_9DEIO|nr:hypothetical protein [Deinococcus metalli]MBB5375321.1 hypothetical protein [Deinococcus metalli]GHF30129.1 hypothetical protein GCM10017781_02760 [Deinococcus metalli]
MPFTLNLAGLTDEELQALLGADRALAVLPDVSRARLAGRHLPGPALPDRLDVVLQGDGVPGSTPELTRAIAQHAAALVAAGAVEAGGTWRQEPGGLWVRPYTLGQDTAVLLRWNELEPAAGVGVQVLTWLKDDASGSAGVLTGNRPAGLVPAPSEEVDVHVQAGLGGRELLEQHAAHVLRHGRTRRLPADAPWWEPWQALYALNLRAWERRGLLLGVRLA